MVQILGGGAGWPVLAEFVDDDVSAYSGNARPQYRAMLEIHSMGAD